MSSPRLHSLGTLGGGSLAITLLDLIEEGASRSSQVKFIGVSGEEVTSFSKLWDLSGEVACSPKLRGATTIAGILTPSAGMIATLVGCLRNGVDFASLPLPATGQSRGAYAEQLAELARNVGATGVVIDRRWRGVVGPLGDAISLLDPSELLGQRGAVGTRAGSLIQFSSGTTGQPKRVRLGCDEVGASVLAMVEALGMDADDRVCGWVPLSHDMGLIGAFFGSWVAAGRRTASGRHLEYTCISPELFLARPLSWMEFCARANATITTAPAFAYQILGRRFETAETMDLSALRACLIGAEPISAKTLELFCQTGSRHGIRESSLCPGYGLAEATLVVSVVQPGTGWKTRGITSPVGVRDVVSCGRVLSCVDVRIGSEGDLPAEGSEIELKGSAVSKDVLASTNDGWHRTGDLGRIIDGELYITGRVDDLLHVHGRKLFAWEIERAAASTAYARPGRCVAVPTDGSYVLFFEASGPDAPTTGALAEVRRALVAVLGVAPRAIGCVPRDSIPKTPSGKLRRRELGARQSEFVGACLQYAEFGDARP